MIRYVDITPTWEDILPVMLMVLENASDPDAQRKIRDEFRRMAEAADKWNATVRAAHRNEPDAPETLDL